MSLPERSATPRDDRTGWEPNRQPDRCLCGTIVTVRGQCARCLHGLCRGMPMETCNAKATLGTHCDACNERIGRMGTAGT